MEQKNVEVAKFLIEEFEVDVNRMFPFLEDDFDEPADSEDQAVMSCETRVKVASMCLLWDAVWQPSLLEFLLAKGGDPNCRARGLGQYTHRTKGPQLLLTACSATAPLQSVKSLLSSHDDKVKLSISRHPKARRMLLCQCINYFLRVQDAIVNSKRKTEEQNELISWVLQLAQRDICALAVAR